MKTLRKLFLYPLTYLIYKYIEVDITELSSFDRTEVFLCDLLREGQEKVVISFINYRPRRDSWLISLTDTKNKIQKISINTIINVRPPYRPLVTTSLC